MKPFPTLDTGETGMRQAVEMPGYGKLGKQWNRFPTFPQPLEDDDTAVVSHIPTATAAAISLFF